MQGTWLSASLPRDEKVPSMRSQHRLTNQKPEVNPTISGQSSGSLWVIFYPNNSDQVRAQECILTIECLDYKAQVELNCQYFGCQFQNLVKHRFGVYWFVLFCF